MLSLSKLEMRKCEDGSKVMVELPDYYSDDMVHQMGPNPHRIWGFTNSSLACIVVTETCSNGYGEKH